MKRSLQFLVVFLALSVVATCSSGTEKKGRDFLAAP